MPTVTSATVADTPGEDSITVTLTGPQGGEQEIDLAPTVVAALAADLLRSLYRRADRMVDGSLWTAIERYRFSEDRRTALEERVAHLTESLEETTHRVADLEADLEEARRAED